MRYSAKHLLAPAFLLLAAAASRAGDFDELKARNWHQWRGPDATGVAPLADPPTSWSESENVRWKVAIDGQGTATPIVWEDRVFLLTVIDTGKVDPNLAKPEDQPERPFGIKYPNTVHQFVVLCLDRASGREMWRRVATELVPHEGHHGDNSFASPSPTTDGRRLIAWFGSAGVYCYDLDGKPLWQRDLGKVETRLSFGEGSSPVLHGDRVIIVRDNEGQSHLAALDAATGEPVWRAERDEPSAWATPLVVEHDGKTQVVTNGKNRVRSYDLADGTLLWECGGQVSNVTPSPVLWKDTVYCTSGYRGSALFALPLDQTGDLTDGQSIKWKLAQGTPYVPSPLLYDGLLYFNQSNNAILTCVDAETGNVLIERTRMPGISNVYASPVGAAGRVYFAGRAGEILVLERGKEFKVLATNKLDDGFDASPAAVGNQLFLRGKKSLYCISSGE